MQEATIKGQKMLEELKDAHDKYSQALIASLNGRDPSYSYVLNLSNQTIQFADQIRRNSFNSMMLYQMQNIENATRRR
jgi:hypothetical protein